MKRNLPHVVAAFYNAPWAILPSKLAELQVVLLRRLADDEPDYEPARLAAKGDTRTDDGYTLSGTAAIVPISGTITPRPSLFSSWSGGTSAEGVAAAVDAAVADPKVDAVVLDINSPGGYAAGIPEAAARIAAAAKQKRIVASVNYQAASAAYWLASAASEIVVAPSGEVGSIGVIAAHVDETKMEEMAGVRTTLMHSTQSPYKSELWPHVPLSVEARDNLQREIDAIAQKFIDDVAKGRGIRSSTVERDFGQGRMKFAQAAVDARMADRIATLGDILNEINGRGQSRNAKRMAADLAEMGLPTN